MNIEQQGEKIVVTIDISDAVIKSAKPSKSGKTLMVASTNGFRRVGPVQISINCTAPRS